MALYIGPVIREAAPQTDETCSKAPIFVRSPVAPYHCCIPRYFVADFSVYT